MLNGFVLFSAYLFLCCPSVFCITSLCLCYPYNRSEGPERVLIMQFWLKQFWLISFFAVISLPKSSDSHSVLLVKIVFIKLISSKSPIQKMKYNAIKNGYIFILFYGKYCCSYIVNPIQMRLFVATHGWGPDQKSSPH